LQRVEGESAVDWDYEFPSSTKSSFAAKCPQVFQAPRGRKRDSDLPDLALDLNLAAARKQGSEKSRPIWALIASRHPWAASLTSFGFHGR